MKIRVITDSSSDLVSEGILKVVPLTIKTSEKEYIDVPGLDVEGMLYDLAKYKGKSSTTCPNTGMFLEACEDADIVYMITLTSGISGGYNAACIAGQMYLESHPNAKVHVFDSLSTAAELRLIVDKVLECVELGLDFDELVKLVNDYKSKTRLFFNLESVHNFAQNGRCNPVVAKVIGVLGIKLFGTASLQGGLQPGTKCRTYGQIIKCLDEGLKECGYNGGKIYLASVYNDKLPEMIKKHVHETYPNADIRIYLTNGLCSYYAERNGLLIGVEGTKVYNQ